MAAVLIFYFFFNFSHLLNFIIITSETFLTEVLPWQHPMLL